MVVLGDSSPLRLGMIEPSASGVVLAGGLTGSVLWMLATPVLEEETVSFAHCSLNIILIGGAMFPAAAVGRSLLTLGALFGVPWPAPFSREAAACAVSLSLSRSRPGAAGSRSTGGCHSGSSFAAAMSAPAKVSGALKSVDYEVFGRVQGVCFRMYTEQEAKKLGVVGWVKNTSQGTVTGQVQGPEERVNEMKSWLSKVGSPSSRIDKTSFSNEKEISKLDFSDFNTRY